MARVVVGTVALFATIGVVLQFTLTVFVADHGVVGGIVRYVSFMSNWNVFAGALVAWATLLAPSSRLASSTARTAMVPLMIVVIVLYELLLRGQDGETILPQRIATDIIHDVVPVSFVLMWALLPHPGLRWRAAAWAMLLPLCYLVFGMARGLIDDFWGYWFLNMNELGVHIFVRNAAGILAAFAVLGLIFVAIDRWVAGRPRGAAGLRSAR